MNVLVTASSRLVIDSNKTLWSANAAHSYSLWQRYLDVFDEVRLCVRARPVAAAPEGWTQVSGPGVVPVPVPYYQGPGGFISSYLSVRRTLAAALASSEAILMRVSCPVGRQAWQMLAAGRPYGVEVVNDPYDVFAPGSVRHPLRPFFRWLLPLQLRRQCAGATAALYVTKQALQRRYPCPSYSAGVSDVHISDAWLDVAPRPAQEGAEPRSTVLVFVGTMAQLYKAPDVLIDAVGCCVEQGLDLRLVMIGDGKHRPELEARAAARSLAGRVVFRGQLASSEAVRAELDQADLFVLPSHQEGLPRAMVEAMARGLPCIGSTVGGIPELLPPADMVPPGDVAALAQKLREVAGDPQRMAAMSARNLEQARGYLSAGLREKRIAFYQYVKEQTARWLYDQQRSTGKRIAPEQPRDEL